MFRKNGKREKEQGCNIYVSLKKSQRMSVRNVLYVNPEHTFDNLGLHVSGLAGSIISPFCFVMLVKKV